MKNNKPDIDEKYSDFYLKQNHTKVYPTEFVVRTFLAKYPDLNFNPPKSGENVLDMAFGDGRNTAFLCDQGFNVAGVEISQKIIDKASERLNDLGYSPELRIGRNSNIPFSNGHFSCILACHCFYYCDEGENFLDNVMEYSRVLKSGGFLVASLAHTDSYIFKGSVRRADGTFTVCNDPYSNRNGYRLMAFTQANEIEVALSKNFTNFSIGEAHNNFFGINEKVFWVVCQNK